MKELIDETTGCHYSMCKSGKRYKVWTPREISELKLWYPKTPNKELAEIFCCTTNMVNKVANQHGWHKDKVWLKEWKRQKGYHCFAIAKDKIIASNKTEERRQHHSRVMKGRKMSEEFSQKVSRGLKRRYQNPANRKALSDAIKAAISKNREEYEQRWNQSLKKANEKRRANYLLRKSNMAIG